jgi:hypothetical protein
MLWKKRLQVLFDRREVVKGELVAQQEMVAGLEISCRQKKRKRN